MDYLLAGSIIVTTIGTIFSIYYCTLSGNKQQVDIKIMTQEDKLKRLKHFNKLKFNLLNKVDLTNKIDRTNKLKRTYCVNDNKKKWFDEEQRELWN